MSDLLRDIASTLCKDVRTIRRWCARGYIPGAYRTKGGHWRVRAARSKHTLIMKILASTRGKRRYRKKEEARPRFGLYGWLYRDRPDLARLTPREFKEWAEKRMAIKDALDLEMLWRIEDPQDLMHSPMWREYSALPGGRAAHDAFVQRTVRPEVLRMTKLSSIERDLVLLIMGRWKAGERITATWLASELNIPRRDFYRHPVTKGWKSIAAVRFCNAAAHDKFLGRKCGHGFREEVCSPPSDDELDEQLDWKEP